MPVCHGYTDLSEVSSGAVAALGNFDGVHHGHRAVIKTACEFARVLGAHCTAAVFSPHPRRVFTPNAPPFALMSEMQRVRALKVAGATTVLRLPFDRNLAVMSPEAFMRDVLVWKLGLKGVVTGADFCFGKGRIGDVDTLTALGETYGVAVRVAAAVNLDFAGEKISSTTVREALRRGDVRTAARLMGRPFSIEGVVVHGDQRGRLLGFPTANIALGAYLRPRFGVYAVNVHLPDGGIAPGVANLGSRPTVDGTKACLEVHLFDFEGDLYSQTLEVDMLAFLRPEQKFDGLDALKAQIVRDGIEARQFLSSSLPV